MAEKIKSNSQESVGIYFSLLMYMETTYPHFKIIFLHTRQGEGSMQHQRFHVGANGFKSFETPDSNSGLKTMKLVMINPKYLACEYYQK